MSLTMVSASFGNKSLALLFKYLAKRTDSKGLKVLDISFTMKAGADYSQAIKELTGFFQNNGSVHTLIIR